MNASAFIAVAFYLKVKLPYHMSICVEYSVEPKSTSGGLYLQTK